ncbi:MAG: nucleotidyltransferase domain-containing protein [Candidatus Bathyarchaeia archaeon]
MNPNRVIEKPSRIPDLVAVRYSEDRWRLLDELRVKALRILDTLRSFSCEGFIHGSIARGDVDQYSDIDVIVLKPVPSQTLELHLSLNGFKIYSRRITQATPGHTPKGHIYLDAYEKISVTFPLITFRPLEVEFYKFGGMADVTALERSLRVPGCTKRLTLIEPTIYGHLESNILGREGEVARRLDVDPEIVRERVRVLMRRDRVGRTGIFLKVDLGENESFERVFNRLIKGNPALRRTYLNRMRS